MPKMNFEQMLEEIRKGYGQKFVDHLENLIEDIVDDACWHAERSAYDDGYESGRDSAIEAASYA